MTSEGVPVLALAALWLAASAAAQPAAVEIATIRLPVSNVHLIKSARPVLVDAGRPGDCEALRAALAGHGVPAERIGLVVLTHGHSDHAGCAADLQSKGAKIALGRGDLPMATSGHHGELQPTTAFAHVLKRAAMSPEMPRFVPDFALDAPLDLAPWGIAGRVLPMPGHTPGSLVVVLDAGQAFVGDMMLGGWFGGAFFATRPGRHYFHADEPANNRNIAALLRVTQPRITAFWLGHGGPVQRDDVAAAFDLR